MCLKWAYIIHLTTLNYAFLSGNSFSDFGAAMKKDLYPYVFSLLSGTTKSS